MDEKTLITVIVPVYNIERYVARCVESIIEQTHTEIEIILVNDGSADLSGVICDIYKEKDSRIRVVHKTNGGLSDARNSGLDIAHGDYIMFVDGDDYIAPDMCEKLLHAVLKQNADIAICNYWIISNKKDGNPPYGNFVPPFNDEVITGRVVLEEKDIDSCRGVWAVSWNKLYRKELFRQVRFPLGKLHEDEFIFFELFSQCNIVVCIKKPLYYHGLREGSIMTSPYSVRRLDACEAFFQRADKQLINGYSSECVYRTTRAGIRLLCAVFDRGLYRDSVYRIRYRELVRQFRRLGVIRLSRNAHGIRRKLFVITNYISPALYWSLIGAESYLKHIKKKNK